jgi:hypothetical protein
VPFPGGLPANPPHGAGMPQPLAAGVVPSRCQCGGRGRSVGIPGDIGRVAGAPADCILTLRLCGGRPSATARIPSALGEQDRSHRWPEPGHPRLGGARRMAGAEHRRLYQAAAGRGREGTREPLADTPEGSDLVNRERCGRSGPAGTHGGRINDRVDARCPQPGRIGDAVFRRPPPQNRAGHSSRHTAQAARVGGQDPARLFRAMRCV